MKRRADSATADLFPATPVEAIAPGAVLLHGFANSDANALTHAIERIAQVSPFRHMETPGGFRMSVAMTNCGAAGWITDRRGYRYAAIDPLTDKPWPAMPALFRALAARAAAAAGFADFAPDACLINRYEPGARMSLHQDKNERDFAQPIVSAVTRAACDFSVRRPQPQRSAKTRAIDRRRCRRLGRSRPYGVSRHRPVACR